MNRLLRLIPAYARGFIFEIDPVIFEFIPYEHK